MFTGLEGEQVPWERERTGRRGEDGQEGRGWAGGKRLERLGYRRPWKTCGIRLESHPGVLGMH